MFKMNQDYDIVEICEQFGYVDEGKVGLATSIMMAASATSFVILFFIAFFILVKYLIIQGKCKRRPMVLFYLASIVVIALKITEFSILIFRPFFDETVLNIHLVGVIAALFVGVIHSYNLMKLISDLRTINAKNDSDYKQM